MACSKGELIVLPLELVPMKRNRTDQVLFLGWSLLSVNMKFFLGGGGCLGLSVTGLRLTLATVMMSQRNKKENSWNTYFFSLNRDLHQEALCAKILKITPAWTMLL
jgi:hypothetical protein